MDELTLSAVLLWFCCMFSLGLYIHTTETNADYLEDVCTHYTESAEDYRACVEKGGEVYASSR